MQITKLGRIIFMKVSFYEITSLYHVRSSHIKARNRKRCKPQTFLILFSNGIICLLQFSLVWKKLRCKYFKTTSKAVSVYLYAELNSYIFLTIFLQHFYCRSKHRRVAFSICGSQVIHSNMYNLCLFKTVCI